MPHLARNRNGTPEIFLDKPERTTSYWSGRKSFVPPDWFVEHIEIRWDDYPIEIELKQIFGSFEDDDKYYPRD